MCIPPKRRPKNWKAKRGRPVVARKDEYRLRFAVERSFAWLWQLPAAADPLGAAVQGLPERIRFRCHAALCAERLPWRARSRWGKSREGSIGGTISATTLEHDLRVAAPPIRD